MLYIGPVSNTTHSYVRYSIIQLLSFDDVNVWIY